MRRFIYRSVLFLALLFYPLTGIIVATGSLSALQENYLSISFLNIPDGEATLIQTAEGKNFLINTGSSESRLELWKLLKELHVDDLEALILTKQTADYCGNMQNILDSFHVKHLYSADSENELETSITSKRTWQRGDKVQLAADLTIHVLQTNKLGEMSFTIQYGKNSILYMGLSGTDSDEELETYHLEPQIIKIADYAQSDSPSSTLLQSMDPYIGIVFNQKATKPNKDLMERLNESWIEVYQLKRVGTTIIRFNLIDYEVIS